MVSVTIVNWMSQWSLHWPLTIEASVKILAPGHAIDLIACVADAIEHYPGSGFQSRGSGRNLNSDMKA